MLRIGLFTAALVVVGTACGGGEFVLPPGTPDCRTVCEMAWPCGGVLANDLDTCIATCNDNDDELYRACVYQTECDQMADCKLYAPASED